MNLKSLISSIKNINSKKVVYKRKVIVPDSDWLHMVVFSIIFIIASGIFGLWVFSIVSSGYFWKMESVPDVKEYKLNKNNLNIFYKYIQDKQEKFQSIPDKDSVKNPFI